MSQERDDALIARMMGDFRKRVGWIAFAPTLYQNGAVASTSTDGAYYADDGKIDIMATVQATAPGAAGFHIYVLVPVPVSFMPATGTNASISLGSYGMFDTGTSFYGGYAWCAGVIVAGSIAFGGIAHNNTGAIGLTPNVALASGDIVSINLTYRLAQ